MNRSVGMKRFIEITSLVVFLVACTASCCAAVISENESVREERLLCDGWRFTREDSMSFARCDFDDSSWESVTVPHDWAIYGPFDRENDLQDVLVAQNLETRPTLKTGRTGGLPYIGTGWYRRMIDTGIEPGSGRRAIVVFDGAMSEARVYVNGTEVIFWPYGYNSFWCDITDALHTDGTSDVLAVRLENRPNSSRWYPGAGLYRNVHLLTVSDSHIPVWGTYITTPEVTSGRASVHVETQVAAGTGARLSLRTDILGPDGDLLASSESPVTGVSVAQDFAVGSPRLWSPETPVLYKAVSRLFDGQVLVDRYETVFGIRSLEYIPEKGFFLNGESRKFQGVCNHHDLGPLGAAVNEAALRRQITMLKDMGCDAIRTSHNMPAPDLVRLCAEMGMMIMVESFDEWDIAKCGNGYHRFFDEWAEKDMVNMLRQFRSNPAVVMWSIGNEVPSQRSPEGWKTVEFLQDICHREDPTRPVTCGMDQTSHVLQNGFAATVDIPGINYHPWDYVKAHDVLPQGFILGSETASTVSSRGVYHFPVEKVLSHCTSDRQSSSYDFDACSWSNLPDVDFALADDYPWTMGQFVWTGFDYIGEPSPYDTDCWPSHSSVFGIIDLAFIPKDRYYLYRSVWNRTEPTLHVLPHWNWTEGQHVPVFVYTSYPEAELFVNGVSHGRRKKAVPTAPTGGLREEPTEERYRLMWKDVVFSPGELKAVAYDAEGNAVAEKCVHTAGEPHHIELQADRTTLSADGKDLAYVTVSVVDKDGNLCPDYDGLLEFGVSGAASYRASANGDPTCLDLFHLPQMHAFNGMLTVIVQAGERPGTARLTVGGKGLDTCKLRLNIK